MAFNHPNFNMFNGIWFIKLFYCLFIINSFFSVAWIVLGHGYMIRLVYAQNPEYIRYLFPNY